MSIERHPTKYDYCSEANKEPHIENNTIICIPNQAIDFGKVNNEILEHTYEIINAGDVPLIITNVHGSGGNMPSEFPRHPIPVGGKEVIKTTLTTKGLKGKIARRWTVYSNTTPRSSHLMMNATLNTCTNDLPIYNEEQLTKICMPEIDYDYGEISSGILTHTFEINNQGNYPLVIKAVKASSGDNVSTYSKDSIRIGEKTIFKVKWNATNARGRTSRTWIMFSNTNPESVRFTLRATILK